MPGTVPIGQASPIYNSALEVRFDEMQDIKVNNFFRSFFPDVICQERYPIIEVRRGTEKVAVDVIRGHQGLRTQITKSSQHAFDTFYYKLFYDATQEECYYRAFGSTSFNLNAGAELVNGIAIRNKANADMIERGVELHCANILENGTCTSLRDGSIIDFKRQAASMVVLTDGNTWDQDGTDPYNDLYNGGVYLREKGKAAGYVINAIFGTSAWKAYRNNKKVIERLSQFNNKRDMVPPAQIQATGGVYQGEIDCDSFIIRCWTYNDFYDNPTGDGTMIAYKNPKTVVMTAENTQFKTLYGATPQLTSPGANTFSLVAAKFVLSDYIDPKAKTHEFYVESAPLPVPITVDRIYTLQVVN